jgi:hypothetical protein
MKVRSPLMKELLAPIARSVYLADECAQFTQGIYIQPGSSFINSLDILQICIDDKKRTLNIPEHKFRKKSVSIINCRI